MVKCFHSFPRRFFVYIKYADGSYIFVSLSVDGFRLIRSAECEKGEQDKMLATVQKVFPMSLDSVPQARVTPGSEPGSIPDGPPARPISKSLERITKIVRAQRFFFRSRSAPKSQTVEINTFSLHGYSSMRMVQDGPKACKEKVSIVATYFQRPSID